MWDIYCMFYRERLCNVAMCFHSVFCSLYLNYTGSFALCRCNKLIVCGTQIDCEGKHLSDNHKNQSVV